MAGSSREGEERGATEKRGDEKEGCLRVDRKTSVLLTRTKALICVATFRRGKQRGLAAPQFVSTD